MRAKILLFIAAIGLAVIYEAMAGSAPIAPTANTAPNARKAPIAPTGQIAPPATLAPPATPATQATPATTATVAPPTTTAPIASTAQFTPGSQIPQTSNLTNSTAINRRTAPTVSTRTRSFNNLNTNRPTAFGSHKAGVASFNTNGEPNGTVVITNTAVPVTQSTATKMTRH